MAAPLFGLLLPGRPVLVEPLTVSQTQYAFTFPSRPAFSHVVVFLMPGITLPPNTLAGTYIQLPGKGTAFNLLGAIGTEKPSAVFKVGMSSSAAPTEFNSEEDSMTDVGNSVSSATASANVTVGISIEAADDLFPQLNALETSQPNDSRSLVRTPSELPRSAPVPTALLAQRIIENAFNFLASFSGTPRAGGEEVIPLKSFRDWWIKFERRVQNDPHFLERQHD